MDKSGNGKLDALRKREAAIRAAIAAERVKQQRQQARARAKLVEIVGSALVEQAASSPDLHLMLKQILGGAVTEPAARHFLEEKGFI